MGAVTIPVVLLLGVAVFFLYRYSPWGAVSLIVVALFGFAVAKSSAADEISSGVHTVTGWINDTAKKAK